MKQRPPILLSAAVLLVSLLPAASLRSQVGGAYRIRFEMSESPDTLFARSVAPIGDRDGDGILDFLVGVPWAGSGGGYYLVAGDGSKYDYFPVGPSSCGLAVASAGDVNGDGFEDPILGAPLAGNQPPDSGVVFVNYDPFQHLAFGVVSGEATNDLFGAAVASAGDVDGDGIPDILVGAPWADGLAGLDAGKAYVYSGLSLTLLYKVEGAASYDNLGRSVAGTGDLDGDGVPDLLLGAPSDPIFFPFPDAGEVLVVSGATGQTIRVLSDPSLPPGSQLGWSVASVPDLNGDGIPEVLAGAPQIEGGSGVAILFSGADGSILHSFTGFPGTYFGWCVAAGGDADGDGVGDLLVGAPFAQSAYLFSGSTWDLLQVLTSGIFGYHAFGTSTAFLGDVEGDGYDEMVVGASDFLEFGSTFGFDSFLQIHGFDPFLQVSPDSFSASHGGLFGFELRFPPEAATFGYRVLISGTGTGPFHLGVDIPLTPDGLLVQSYYGVYPFDYSFGLQGSLDANAQAAGTIGILPRSPSIVGRTFWMAAVAEPPGGLPAYSSVAAPVEVLP
ncbi:MAG: hypothetical protein D6702_05825 [Planctomycetota bacterium]|nr:MAG: hypothetical protein D6702_05825 [Planctomycetota bacterium]